MEYSLHGDFPRVIIVERRILQGNLMGGSLVPRFSISLPNDFFLIAPLS